LIINILLTSGRLFVLGRGVLNHQSGSKAVISTFQIKKRTIMSEVTLTAYNVKTKEKGVPIQDAVITKTAKGAYMAQGNDGKGNKLTTLLGEAKALAAIEAGIAKQGW
jgi:hypothetical protein